MQTVAPTWKHKVNADDTVVFGGDLAATAGAPLSYSSGASSVERAVGGNYVELDFTFDAKSSGHAIFVGLGTGDPDQNINSISMGWQWDGSQILTVQESGSQKSSAGVVSLPMSCRIILDLTAGTCTYRKNAGSDVLQYTSTLTPAQLRALVEQGLIVDASFYGTSGKFHATLKADDGHIGTPTRQIFDDTEYVNNEGLYVLRTPVFSLGVESTTKVRPTEGKLWPRNF